MQIREATAADWPAIHPVFDAIVSAGRTYAYPEGLSPRGRPVTVDGPAAGPDGGGRGG